MQFLRDIQEKHERLKKRIHSFRLPLSPTGQRIMGFIYFTIPIIIGYNIMQVAISRSEVNLSNIKKPQSGSVNNATIEQNKALQTVLDQIQRKP